MGRRERKGPHNVVPELRNRVWGVSVAALSFLPLSPFLSGLFGMRSLPAR